MLAVVKKPHTEISLHGKGANKILQFLKQKFSVEVIDQVADNSIGDAVELRETDWWKHNKHRKLAGFRHKINMTQKELAELSGIRQSVISEYERGKRPLTLKAATRLATHLKVKPEQLM